MPKINLKLYIGLSVVILLILILTYRYYSTKNNSSTIIVTQSPEITVTTYQPEPTFIITPEIVIPTDFTGAIEEKLPPEIQSLSEQKQELKTEMPLSQPTFDLIFDYGEDKFKVSLKTPKEQARTDFESWLQNNFPDIPLDRFIIN